jgi:hypothetical protein
MFVMNPKVSRFSCCVWPCLFIPLKSFIIELLPSCLFHHMWLVFVFVFATNRTSIRFWDCFLLIRK